MNGLTLWLCYTLIFIERNIAVIAAYTSVNIVYIRFCPFNAFTLAVAYSKITTLYHTMFVIGTNHIITTFVDTLLRIDLNILAFVHINTCIMIYICIFIVLACLTLLIWYRIFIITILTFNTLVICYIIWFVASLTHTLIFAITFMILFFANTFILHTVKYESNILVALAGVIIIANIFSTVNTFAIIVDQLC